MNDDFADFDFTDESGEQLVIKPFGTGVLVALMPEDESKYRSAHVPPHKWPELCRAGYRSLGLPVPDLPGIPEPALVDALADDLGTHAGFDDPEFTLRRTMWARALVAAGWRKDGAR